MDPTLLAGLIQAAATLCGGALAVVVAFFMVRRHELSRARVDCVRRLFAYRFGVIDDVDPAQVPIQNFLAALNEVPFLFAKHPGIMAKYRDLRDQGFSNDRLAALLRALAPHVAVDFRPLADGDIAGIFTAKQKLERR